MARGKIKQGQSTSANDIALKFDEKKTVKPHTTTTGAATPLYLDGGGGGTYKYLKPRANFNQFKYVLITHCNVP